MATDRERGDPAWPGEELAAPNPRQPRVFLIAGDMAHIVDDDRARAGAYEDDREQWGGGQVAHFA